jgi:hypothetical protein
VDGGGIVTGQGPAIVTTEPRGQRATGQGPVRQSFRHPEASVSHPTYYGIESDPTDFDPRIILNGAPVAVAGSRRVTRKDFTDRLGLQESATNAQFMAALEARIAQRPQPSASPSAEEQLWARMSGRSPQQEETVDMSDDTLWNRLFISKTGA